MPCDLTKMVLKCKVDSSAINGHFDQSQRSGWVVRASTVLVILIKMIYITAVFLLTICAEAFL